MFRFLTLPNLEGLPLGLASLTKRHFFISRRRLLEDFGKHYKGEVMRHWNKVLLHADLSSVVSDKVAAMTGGHARGAATSLSTSLSAAPGDGKDGKPRHVAEGVLQGGLGLGRGIFSGITGLVAAPLSGAREGAAEGKALSGFARGLGRGLVGAAVKPTAGVLGLAAKTAEGLRNTPRFLEAEAGQVRDAAVRVSGVSGGHAHPEGGEGGERAARLAAHVQGGLRGAPAAAADAARRGTRAAAVR